MKRLLFAATMLATLFVSCMKSEIEVVTVIPSSEDFTASFENATRTELDGTAVVWNENDLLTIFTKTSHNRKYEIKSLSTDCRTATFSYVGFTGTDGTKITTNYALYPYDAEATLANGVITTKWASEQTYDAETGNLSYALMTAASETTNFTFANAGALLRFKLSKIVPDEFTLRGIKLTSATQNIAGEITIDLNGNKRAVVTDNGVDSITLEAIDTEITLDVQEFYVAMPAMSFNKGDLSVTFMFDEGNKEFALPAFELAQGSIKNIDYTIKDAEEFTGSTPNDGPANNEIWYTNGSTTEATTPNKTDVFGANILSNTYDAEKECWVIKFDGDVTTIGLDAFRNCSSLTSVTIPDSLTTIGYQAFSHCSSLTSVTIGNSVTTIRDYAFYDCSSLTSITIPDSVTTIGYGAFYDCSSLTSVTIPDSVTTIGEDAFCNCSQLQEFKGKFASDDGRCLIQDGTLIAFAPAELTEYAIPDSVTTIGYGAFYDCSSLTSITIPDSVTTIGEDAFYNCTSLTSVTIPDSVTTIGVCAFAVCDGLTSITISDSVTTIDEATFAGCSGLTSVNIPNGVTTIGEEAFSNCNGLTSVTIPDSVTTIGNYAFYDCSSLTSVNIPNGVTTIGDYTFAFCYSLTSVNIPDSVTTIGEDAFVYCYGLTSVTIPDSVTTIDSAAFSCCSGLTSVTIPDSVTTIGDKAFSYCISLTCVYCEAVNPPEGGNQMFLENPSERKIYVPTDSVDAYKSASGWSEYADAIEGYDF